MISLITGLSLVAALATFLLGARKQKASRTIASASALFNLALVLVICGSFDCSSGRLQFEEIHAWIPTLGVEYHVGIDGLGLLMLLLTGILIPMSIFASWDVTKEPNLYFALILCLQAGFFGTFTALNFFQWFLFWELSLVPAFFLILLWGGPLRTSAAIQFFIFTMVGSVALLLAFLAIFQCTGTFDFIALGNLAHTGKLSSAISAGIDWPRFVAKSATVIVFFGAFLGLAIKVPIIPFHSWLPPAYTEAPTPVTMLLTGLMSKMGVYGFLRILLPIFFREMIHLRTPLLCLAVVTVVFSSYVALVQTDLKRIFAYSSINHLGYCMLGIFAVASFPFGPATMIDRTAALNGVMFQIFNHGLTSSTMFWLVALLEKRSGGLRGLNDFGGLRKAAPIFSGLMGITIFSSLGLPGLGGFVGEFLILKGVFSFAPWAVALSILGLGITAIFLLTILQRVFSGPLKEQWLDFPDLSKTDQVMIALPIVLMFIIGIYPQLLIRIINDTTMKLIQQLGVS